MTRGIVSVEQCWNWWAGKNPGIDVRQARVQALRHLEALELRRPLDGISDAAERNVARNTRAWIRRNLLQAPDSAGDM